MFRSFRAVGLAVLLLTSEACFADSITINPYKDNTIIQTSDASNQLSNGTGDIYIGRTNQDGQDTATISIRRGLIAFDIADYVPAGATITSVSLTMTTYKGNGIQPSSLHRMLQDWGEGTSYFDGGRGTTPTNNDVTWLYNFYNADDPSSSSTWDTVGGSYVSTTSATATVNSTAGATATWSDVGMVADVQAWLDDPTTNYGWIIIGNENAGQTAMRLDSREDTAPPTLTIEYTVSSVPEPASFGMIVVGLTLLAGWRRFRTGNS